MINFLIEHRIVNATTNQVAFPAQFISQFDTSHFAVCLKARQIWFRATRSFATRGLQDRMGGRAVEGTGLENL